MNRVARRRQQKLATKAARTSVIKERQGTQKNLIYADKLRSAGELVKAESIYQYVLQSDSNNLAALNNLAAIAGQMLKYNIAVEMITKAIAVEPNNPLAYYNLAKMQKEQGKLNEAVTSYNKALAIKPDYAAAHNNLGSVLKRQGKIDEAIASYLRALDLEPDFAEVWNNLNFVIKTKQYLTYSKYGEREGKASEMSAVLRGSFHFVLQQFFLNAYIPHEAEESFKKVIAALPAITNETLSINKKGKQPSLVTKLSDNIVALLHYGRSGTGLLHSLIDGHPEISTLPSVYLRGYFMRGVWERLSADSWRRLPENFANEFAVLFDARSMRPIPSRLGEGLFQIGMKEGMTAVGESRNEYLSLNKEVFCKVALRLMKEMENINPMSFLMVIHATFEEMTTSNKSTHICKHLCFYHIHNPDDYAISNFLRYAPNVRLLMTVREPIQNCVSKLRNCLDDYNKCVGSILALLFGFDCVPFHMRDSIGVRLEDLKIRPEKTIEALSAWLGVEANPSLFEMTAQGKKWWGDPSSPNYSSNSAMSPFGTAKSKGTVGEILSKKDQFIFGTLFYPFSVRFGYREADPKQFQSDLKEIRPLIDDMFDIEKVIAKRMKIDYNQIKINGDYQLLRAGMVDRWNVLDELGDYPQMLAPLIFE